ncbi:MAG: hypothetical protein ACK6D7_21960, partial [Acidobacteriota bacterium]
MNLLFLLASVLTLTITDPSGAPVRATGQLDQLATGVSTRFTANPQGPTTLGRPPGRGRRSRAHPRGVTPPPRRPPARARAYP